MDSRKVPLRHMISQGLLFPCRIPTLCFDLAIQLNSLFFCSLYALTQIVNQDIESLVSNIPNRHQSNILILDMYHNYFLFKYSLLVYLLLFHNKLLNLSINLQLYFPCNYGSIDFFEYRWLRRCIANQIIFPTNSLGSSLICLFLIGRWKGWSFYDNLCFILLALDHVKQSVFLLPLSHVILFLSLLSHIY